MNNAHRACFCAACLLTPTECHRCQAPMRREVWERQEGVCTKCIPLVPIAFRSARQRVVDQQKADQAAARVARARQRRQEARRGRR